MSQQQPSTASRRSQTDELVSWWRPAATFASVAAVLFFGLTEFAADQQRAPAILRGAPLWAIVGLSLTVAFVCAFVLAPWKRIHVSFGSPATPEHSSTTFRLSDGMVREIDQLFRSGHYHAVLRRARWFSRYLWVERCLDQRIQVGGVVKQAALRVKDREAQAAALIDDLGWSYVIRGEFQLAREHLHDGLRVAEAADLPFWIAKGHRHLCGLNIEIGEYDQGYAELDLAEAAANRIEHKGDRDEILVSIVYGRALCALRAEDYNRCLTYVAEAEDLSKGAGRESVKGYSLRGTVLLRQGRIGPAEAEFQQGIVASIEVANRDEQIRNRRGLAEVYALRGDFRKAQEEQAIVAEIQSETPVPYELSDPFLTDKGKDV